ncbi:hypothetical protein HX001_06400 [Empedobacter brevis]|uniref:Uncharacterized protein n=2 Tax=Empedobacter TaxID=59734 RepID=A0AAJ1V8P6_9FLAO|nr:MULTISPECIES: hypothetical protein [Empedobacter]MDM1072125.1 hypothetical protein [Empedobacter brevis]
MKRYKLPFKISLERKYNDITIDRYLEEREEYKEERKNRTILMDNDLHIEIGKFKTFDLSQAEVIDLALRYALGKQEFRKLSAQLIELKSEQNKTQ